MEDAVVRGLAGQATMPRQVEKHWNGGLIAASIAVSLLGAFTSTQLMCQARTSQHFSGVLVWAILASFTFGFCSIWSLHEVAMLACELDLPIGIDVPLTILSAMLAVFFTFAALATDLLWDRYQSGPEGRSLKRKKRRRRQGASAKYLSSPMRERSSSEALLEHFEQEHGEDNERQLDLELRRPSPSRRLPVHGHENAMRTVNGQTNLRPKPQFGVTVDPAQPSLNLSSNKPPFPEPSPSPTDMAHSSQEPQAEQLDDTGSDIWTTESLQRSSSEPHTSRRESSVMGSGSSSFGLRQILSVKTYQRSSCSAKNTFLVTAMAVYTGSTRRNILKGFLWSLAITGMHYVGILALHIPGGYLKLDPILVPVSGLISWIVCLAGCILMPQMEVHLLQQFLFSAVATTGVAAMHFTGMRAATFWSYEPPSDARGYPPALAVVIGGIAITTCIMANALLAHAATVSRNKLAEIVFTRKKLWMAIAQKENAESAAAARSEFIASASHEIRTPLHHLQGYSDLLSRTELTEEGRLLLYAIQRATKTLSLITNNVLDWSRLERDGEAVCRPVALDIRTVCESIITLLPTKDDEIDAELMVVVSPEFPDSVFIDETYIHRILMNLLSNALKFTSSGYILLLVEMEDTKLVATVQDTGSGVPPSFQPLLFEPFKQAQTRGSQRGTGLGLSIIKQLLQKMQGTIEVESRHLDTEGVEPGQTGSTFTVKIPVQLSAPPQFYPPPSEDLPKVAIFHCGNQRSLAGLCMAWEKYGYEVILAKQFSDLCGLELKYIWADLPFLKQYPAAFEQLMEQDKWRVLVPYDTQTALQEVPGVLQGSQFCPVPKPVIWHCLERNIAASDQLSDKPAQARTVRFAPKVEVLKTLTASSAEIKVDTKQFVILLVEDNPINRKLGVKILTSLAYEVLTAEDGQDAIEQLIKHDSTIDAILMDQSMPRKDGLTATREIRAMEAAGTLSRRRPIIAVTAVVSAQAQELCKEAGTDDFLAKPLSIGKLEQTLATYLSPTNKT